MITWNDENHEFYYYAYIYNEPDGEKYYTEYSTGTYSTPCNTAPEDGSEIEIDEKNQSQSQIQSENQRKREREREKEKKREKKRDKKKKKKKKEMRKKERRLPIFPPRKAILFFSAHI